MWVEGVSTGEQSLVPNPSPKQALGSDMHHELQILADPDAVARAGAAFVAERARAAVAASGTFHFAVSGGHTPWAMFAELAS
jgi:Glucosamine-6-phosphate isomerases/6-phosphogluconolactonase